MARFLLFWVGIAAGGELLTLDSSVSLWRVAPQNSSYSIPALVPGCVHLDLLRAGLIGEPNEGYNEELQLWIPSENFTYTATFAAPPALATLPHQYLLLSGVDTAAAVSLNGIPLGEVDNMHRTFLLPIPSGALHGGGNNTLCFAFTGAVPASLARQAQCEASSRPCAFGNCTCPSPWPGPAPSPLLINAYLRKEQMSFSWDFAPSTGTAGLREAPVLLGFASSALRAGAVVSMALSASSSAWEVNVTVRVLCGGSCGSGGGTQLGVLSASIPGLPGAAASAPVAVPGGAPRGEEVDAVVRLVIPASLPTSPRLWWPNGYGEPALYTLHVAFNSTRGEVSVHPPLSIGFRAVELDQAPAPNEGNHFRLRVNGVLIHARGANWVPHNTLPLRPGAQRELEGLFESAVFAHFNILRVWGGGVYASPEFMALADANGILVFHDAMLGDQFYNTQPAFLAGIGEEVRDNLFRLGHHASLAVLCGSNEMEAGYSDDHHLPPTAVPFYSALYFDTVLANYSALLPFTPTLASTPSNGNETREHPWSTSAEVIDRGDVHWYNLEGDCFNASSYPRARWVTEHGWESFPSFLTLAPTLTSPADFAFNSSLVASRQQHPPGQRQITQMVELNWGWPPRAVPLHRRTARYSRLQGVALQLAAAAPAAAAAAPGALHPYLFLLNSSTSPLTPNATAFRDELFMTQVAAGQCLALALQRWRSFADDYSHPGGGTAGLLYWQFSEPWPGPSWATTEVGGRRKVGHYLAAQAFAPLLLSATLVPEEGGLLVHASFTTYNATVLPPPQAKGALTLRAFAWRGGVLGSHLLPGLPLPPAHTTALLATLELPALLQQLGCPAPEQCLLGLSLAEEAGGRVLAEGHALLTPPRAFLAAGLPDPGLAITSVVPLGGSGRQFNISLTSRLVPVPFVWLETPFAGAWSRNGVVMLSSAFDAIFTAETPLDAGALATSLAVSSLYDIYG